MPENSTGIIMLWRGFTSHASPGLVSISELIEENAELYKSRYLSWVFNIGEMRLQGRRIVDHLQLWPGLSYWWMTLLTEKCNFAKSPNIDDAIRFLAFSDWAINRSIKRITLVSSKKPLSECFRVWCEKSGVAFEFNYRPKFQKRNLLLYRERGAFSVGLHAILWLLKYLFERWSLRGTGLENWKQTEGSVTFVSYIDNLVRSSENNGRFESRYWANLPDVLERANCKINWLHIYIKDDFLTNSRKAAELIKNFNELDQGQATHASIDTFLSVTLVLHVIKDWLRLISKFYAVKDISNVVEGNSLNLWPLFVDDWRNSMFGQCAMKNLVQRSLFVIAMNSIKEQRIGVYLQENQSWEFGFINAWKAAGHSKLIGCPHGTVRYWDLRYFFDPRTYERFGKNTLPLPDNVAVNGKVAFDNYVTGGYPRDDLINVEALRYLHLDMSRSHSLQKNAKSSIHSLRLLVLGDYLPSNTEFQLKLLNSAAALLPKDLLVTVKPHPNCPIDSSEYPALNIEISMEPIAVVLSKCDVAYASAVTSAAVDAYCCGISIVCVLNPDTLNLSPLRGCAGVSFASNPKELAAALINAAPNTLNEINRPEYFTIDAQLPKWRDVLL